MKLLFPCVLLALALCNINARAADLDSNAPPRGATATEIKQGNQAAAEFEKPKDVKLLDPKSSPAAQVVLDKLNGMARKLGAISSRPDIK